jgi:hypothetical protein
VTRSSVAVTHALRAGCPRSFPARTVLAARLCRLTAKAVQHRYTRDEVDFFLGYAVGVDTVFVFPFDNAFQLLRA